MFTLVPVAKYTLIAVALSAACLVAGFLAASLVLSAYMFLPLPLVFVFATTFLAGGAVLCFLSARRVSSLWILWPLLFGGSMFILGAGGEYSPPDPGGTFLWWSLAAAYSIVPALAAFSGRAENRLAHENAVESPNSP